MTALPLLWAAMSAVAYAASGAEKNGGAGDLGTVVLLVLVVGVAYVLAHNVVERLQRRFLVVSGAEYLLLGVLLGPVIPHIGVFDNMTGIVPIIALAAALVGFGFFLPQPIRQLLEEATRIILIHQGG